MDPRTRTLDHSMLVTRFLDFLKPPLRHCLTRYLPQVELEPLDSQAWLFDDAPGFLRLAFGLGAAGQDYTHPWDTRPEARDCKLVGSP